MSSGPPSRPPCRAWAIRVIVRPSAHCLGPTISSSGFLCRRWGHHALVVLFASSSTPPWRSCPVRVVIALSVSWWHCPCRRRPRRVVLLLFAVGPTCRAWAVRVLVDPVVSRLCCSLLGPRVVVRLFASSFGPPCRLRVVVELAVSLPTPSHHPGPICVIVVYSRRCWPFASSFGPPCRPSAARVFLGLALWLCGPVPLFHLRWCPSPVRVVVPPCHCSAVPGYSDCRDLCIRGEQGQIKREGKE